MSAHRLAAALTLVCSPIHTAAQEQRFSITVSHEITPEQPTADIEVWATFDPIYYAIFRANFAMATPQDQGMFVDPIFPKPFYGDEGYVWPDGDSVTGIRAEQFIWMGVDGDTSNPVKIWSCTWTTDDFTPRRVELSLVATQFWVYLNHFGQGLQVDFVPEAFGQINVVPAPAAGVAVLGLGATRRRR
jgi:hypothetical protein